MLPLALVIVMVALLLCDAVEQQGHVPEAICAAEGTEILKLEAAGNYRNGQLGNERYDTVGSQDYSEVTVEWPSFQKRNDASLSLSGPNGLSDSAIDESTPVFETSYEITKDAAEDAVEASQSDAKGMTQDGDYGSLHSAPSQSTPDTAAKMGNQSVFQTLDIEDIQDTQNQAETPRATEVIVANGGIEDDEGVTRHCDTSENESNHVLCLYVGNETTDVHSTELDLDDQQRNDLTSSLCEDVPGERGFPNKDKNSSTKSPLLGRSTPIRSLDPDYLDLDEPVTIVLKTSNVSEDLQRDSENETPSYGATIEQEEIEELDTGIEELLDPRRGKAENWKWQLAGLDKAPPKQHEETTLKEFLPTEDEKTPQDGSLDSLFEKITNQRQTFSCDHKDVTGEGKRLSDLGSPKPTGDISPLENAGRLKESCGTWGISNSNKRHADLKILGRLFDNQLVDNASSRYKKVFDPMVDLMAPAFYARTMTGEKLIIQKASPSDSITPIGSRTKRRSVNTEFVEGLDDINKFFEGVDPPDELDVGAAGTSIQDVLMGQTSKIIIKRVTLGAYYVSKMITLALTRQSEYMAHEGRKLLELIRKHCVQARDWIVNRWKLMYAFFQSIYKDGGELGAYSSYLQRKLKDIAWVDESEPLQART